MQNGGTSCITPAVPPTIASRPTRTNWWNAASPPIIARSSTLTCPASVARLAMITLLPTWQSWATCTPVISMQRLPTRVTPSPWQPRLTVTYSRMHGVAPISQYVGSPR